jgi:hypothetical protein
MQLALLSETLSVIFPSTASEFVNQQALKQCVLLISDCGDLLQLHVQTINGTAQRNEFQILILVCQSNNLKSGIQIKARAPNEGGKKSENKNYFSSGLWSRYAKAPTPTPRFLKLRLRLLHKSSICINNGKPIRRFIATT